MPELDPEQSARACYARSRARERTRASLAQEALGAHPSMVVSGKLIGHVENGRRPPTPRIFRGFDKALGLKEHFEAPYELMVRETGEPPAICEYFDPETRASSIKTCDGLWINGLPQTEETAREPFSPGRHEEEVEESAEYGRVLEPGKSLNHLARMFDQITTCALPVAGSEKLIGTVPEDPQCRLSAHRPRGVKAVTALGNSRCASRPRPR